MHMGMLTGTDKQTFRAGAPPYATNVSWDWTLEQDASIPTPGTAGAAAFWEWLFATMSDAGLGVYKLDHTQTQMPNMDYLLRTPGSTKTWLAEMAVAAARHNIDKQCAGRARPLSGSARAARAARAYSRRTATLWQVRRPHLLGILALRIPAQREDRARWQ